MYKTAFTKWGIGPPFSSKQLCDLIDESGPYQYQRVPPSKFMMLKHDYR